MADTKQVIRSSKSTWLLCKGNVERYPTERLHLHSMQLANITQTCFEASSSMIDRCILLMRGTTNAGGQCITKLH